MVQKDLEYRGQTISIMEKMIFKQNKKIEEMGTTSQPKSQRTFEQFRARLMDQPWTEVLKPIFDKEPYFEQIISNTVLTKFTQNLITLQQEILEIYFNPEKHSAIRVVQRPETEQLLLQVDLDNTSMHHDKILQFFHNGMIDTLEFVYSEKTVQLFERFGKKFLITTGNISSFDKTTFIKILATYPKMSGISYIPSRKRVIITNDEYIKVIHIKQPDDFTHISSEEKIKELQNSRIIPKIPRWQRFKLLAEGHYVQIWSTTNWHMYLPFSGEGDTLTLEDIHNTEDTDMETVNSDNDTIPTIPDTHRDL